MKKLLGIIGLVLLLVACGTTGRQPASRRGLVSEDKDTLSYEQRRKYDYFFLEAVRMKQKGEYDAAFELYKHCLDIYPNSAPALYEISRFYMVLGLEKKGEEALKKQSVRMNRISGTSRRWRLIISRNGIGRKPLPYMMTWHISFLLVWSL